MIQPYLRFFLLDLFDSVSDISSLVFFFHWKLMLLLLASIPVGFSLKSEFSVRKHVYGIPLVCSFVVLDRFLEMRVQSLLFLSVRVWYCIGEWARAKG